MIASTPEDVLKELEELDAKATGGYWINYDDGVGIEGDDTHVGDYLWTCGELFNASIEDIDLVVALHNKAIPALRDSLTENARLRTALSEANNGLCDLLDAGKMRGGGKMLAAIQAALSAKDEVAE